MFIFLCEDRAKNSVHGSNKTPQTIKQILGESDQRSMDQNALEFENNDVKNFKKTLEEVSFFENVCVKHPYVIFLIIILILDVFFILMFISSLLSSILKKYLKQHNKFDKFKYLFDDNKAENGFEKIGTLVVITIKFLLIFFILLMILSSISKYIIFFDSNKKLCTFATIFSFLIWIVFLFFRGETSSILTNIPYLAISVINFLIAKYLSHLSFVILFVLYFISIILFIFTAYKFYKPLEKPEKKLAPEDMLSKLFQQPQTTSQSATTPQTSQSTTTPPQTTSQSATPPQTSQSTTTSQTSQSTTSPQTSQSTTTSQTSQSTTPPPQTTSQSTAGTGP